MTTTDLNPKSPDYGQSVRGFTVLIAGKRDSRHAGKVFSLPCTGFPPYTGTEAIKTLRAYVKRGFKCCAQTESLGEIEQLTLEEMEQVVLQ